MGYKVNFELNERDLKHFRREMKRAREAVRIAEDAEILDAARSVVEGLDGLQIPEFISIRMDRINMLMDMVSDSDWGLSDRDRELVLGGLAYFSDPEDIIPDHIPGLGFLDDAIMVELILRELRHEIEAYEDFVAFRDSLDERFPGEDQDQHHVRLMSRKQALQQRMRRRRERDKEEAAGSSQPASLW